MWVSDDETDKGNRFEFSYFRFDFSFLCVRLTHVNTITGSSNGFLTFSAGGLQMQYFKLSIKLPNDETFRSVSIQLTIIR